MIALPIVMYLAIFTLIIVVGSERKREAQELIEQIKKRKVGWYGKEMSKKVTHRRFMPEKPYVESFERRGEPVPPFLVFQPYEIRDDVPGYMVPCNPDHPDAEPVEEIE